MRTKNWDELMSREVVAVCENCWVVTYRWRPAAAVKVSASPNGAIAWKWAQTLASSVFWALTHLISAAVLYQRADAFVSREC